MSKEPRTHDDGRNERQRQRDENWRAPRTERPHDDGRTPRQRIAEEQQSPEFADRMAEERKRHDFIERTRPDDPSDRLGQLTRDNVNPDIPSARPGEGPIVDPHTLGMPQGGVAPPPPPEPQQRTVDEGVQSINEPPGSQVQPPPPDTQQQPAAAPPVRDYAGDDALDGEDDDEPEPLPSDSELHTLTRAELDELAKERGLDPDKYANKDEVIAALKKDARKRK